MKGEKVQPLDAAAMALAQAQWNAVAKPLNSLGRFEKLVIQMAGITGDSNVQVSPACVLVCCADNGVVAEGVSQSGQDVTRRVAQSIARGEANVNLMAQAVSADVFCVDMGMAERVPDARIIDCSPGHGTGNIACGPAMTREEAERAVAQGKALVQTMKRRGYRMIATGEMGIGNTTSTAAIVSAFLGLPPELTVGRGTGINDERMAIKRKVVADGLAKNQPKLGDAMDILCKVGGYDHAGLAGMIVAGARRRVPTMVDGVNATAAALLAYGIEPSCAEYMICSHLSAEISHAKMLEVLQLRPIVDAGMRLGEGTGASLAIVILQMAINTYQELHKRGAANA